MRDPNIYISKTLKCKKNYSESMGGEGGGVSSLNWGVLTPPLPPWGCKISLLYCTSQSYRLESMLINTEKVKQINVDDVEDPRPSKGVIMTLNSSDLHYISDKAPLYTT